MQMTCPKCHGEMRVYERSGVTIDQCTECRGIFLDRGELEKLFAAEATYNRSAPAPGPAAHTPPPPPPAPHGGHGYVPPPPPPPAYGTPVHHAPPAAHYPPAVPHYGHHGHYRQPHYGHHGHYRRRSFLHDLFD
ncbi:Zn-finger nucleic acid-binding protein [Actinoplanes octamycinicus]|uniref:Zn-finger nucleic acid-binding protein n=1 Tax=Actinoplanes octamycinicus TaxID=135948 RepID=A0A7W7GTN5_9ACTN|nr:zf-TFIIB domain-containing protein [Actinoplanes octamycinicus]MBB4738084.1 Zn-finger nucleic acid-binding protein [Actinoplanes octamycinicus]